MARKLFSAHLYAVYVGHISRYRIAAVSAELRYCCAALVMRAVIDVQRFVGGVLEVGFRACYRDGEERLLLIHQELVANENGGVFRESGVKPCDLRHCHTELCRDSVGRVALDRGVIRRDGLF